MIKIIWDEEHWYYVVTLNNTSYTTCDTMHDAEREAETLRRELRVGR